MNIFYCNGIIPVLLSGALLKKKYANTRNVIIIELDDTRPLFISASATSIYENKILDLLVECSQWDEVNKISFINNLLAFRYFPWPFSHFPIASISLIKNKNKILKSVKNILNKLSKSDKLIISDNSMLTKYFIKEYPDAYLLEHGAASYRSKLQDKNLRYYTKEVLSKLTKVSFNFKIKSIYLSDNKQSSRSDDFFKSGQGITPLSYDLSTEIKDIYSKFILKLEQRYPLAFQELTEVKRRYENDSLYFYLPTGIIPNNEYKAYLENQLKHISNKDAIFIVKPHGNDTKRDYCSYFNTLGQKSQVFNNKINTFIPIEFLILFFEGSTILSSYSTAHLYAKWWLNKKTIFAEVKSSPKNDLLIREYRSVYSDMQNL
jgi:hypothetical protein